MNMAMAKELALKDKMYSQLLAQWNTAVSRVYECRNDTGLSNYTVPDEAEDDELRFVALGLKLFMRFRHNFDRGTIEYGIIRPTGIDGQYSRVSVIGVDFDRQGNLMPPYDYYPVKEYDRAHLEILASNLSRFVKAAHDLEESE